MHLPGLTWGHMITPHTVLLTPIMFCPGYDASRREGEPDAGKREADGEAQPCWKLGGSQVCRAPFSSLCLPLTWGLINQRTAVVALSLLFSRILLLNTKSWVQLPATVVPFQWAKCNNTCVHRYMCALKNLSWAKFIWNLPLQCLSYSPSAAFKQ